MTANISGKARIREGRYSALTKSDDTEPENDPTHGDELVDSRGSIFGAVVGFSRSSIFAVQGATRNLIIYGFSERRVACSVKKGGLHGCDARLL